MDIAELDILRNVQQFHFPEELNVLSKSEDSAQVKKGLMRRARVRVKGAVLTNFACL